MKPDGLHVSNRDKRSSTKANQLRAHIWGYVVHNTQPHLPHDVGRAHYFTLFNTNAYSELGLRSLPQLDLDPVEVSSFAAGIHPITAISTQHKVIPSVPEEIGGIAIPLFAQEVLQGQPSEAGLLGLLGCREVH
jgi:hypothetical protein